MRVSVGWPNRRQTPLTAPDEILHSILPQNEEDDLPSSFTHTGHIAHMNLRTEWLPYKNIIGEVLVKVSS
jgi:tRNA G37 N-methylase Trm5